MNAQKEVRDILIFRNNDANASSASICNFKLIQDLDGKEGFVRFINDRKLIIKWEDGELELFDSCDGREYRYNSLGAYLSSVAAQPDNERPWEKLDHLIPRYGMLCVHQDRDTIIACLMSVCPVFDKIYIFYHNGANDDGSIDLVQDFVAKGQNEKCEIIIEHYPYNVYFVNDPKWLNEEICPEQVFGTFRQRAQEGLIKHFGDDGSYHWALIDSDQIYIPYLFEESFRQADLRTLQGIPAEIQRIGYNSMPQDDRLQVCKRYYYVGTSGDHLTVNSLARIVFMLDPFDGGDDRRTFSRLDGVDPVYFYTNVPPSWFHFRKGMWRGAPPKVRAEDGELEEFTPKMKEEFETFIRPLLKISGSRFASICL